MPSNISCHSRKYENYIDPKPRTKTPNPEYFKASFLKAVREATLLLSDHKWHKCKELKKIAKRNHTTYLTLAEGLQVLAESDNGHYVCFPSNSTPEAVPSAPRTLLKNNPTNI